MLRAMIKNGYIRKDGKYLGETNNENADDDGDIDFRYRYSNTDLLRICKTTSVTDFTAVLQARYLAHVARRQNLNTAKQLLFNSNKHTKTGRPTETLEQRVMAAQRLTADCFYRRALERKL